MFGNHGKTFQIVINRVYFHTAIFDFIFYLKRRSKIILSYQLHDILDLLYHINQFYHISHINYGLMKVEKVRVFY